MSVIAQPVVPAPYDSMLVAVPAAGVAATCTFPATPGKAWLIHSFFFEIFGRLAVSPAFDSTIQIVSNGVTLWVGSLTLPAVTAVTAANEKIAIVGVSLKGDLGFSVVLSTSIPPALAFSRISAGAYLI
jgi:hypothetical protein